MFYSSGPKRTHCRQVQWFYCCWCQLTAGKAEAGLAATDVLAAWWWLEERLHVGVGRVVKTTVVCQTVGSSSLTVDSQRS